MAVIPDLPAEVEPEFYRRANPDLRHLDDLGALKHYRHYGAAEGRLASPASTRSGLVSLVPETADVLEVGPFCRPAIAGENVDYFDVLTTEELRVRARSLELEPSGVPEITYASPTGDLSIVDRQYDVVLSCHTIEHQPDLVRHLNDVAAILSPGGVYMAVVPDCRYCIDHHLARTSVADVLDAFYERRKAHSLKSVIEHLALVSHNDPVRHWRGDHGVQGKDVQAIRAAVGHWEATEDGYLDVHAWHFTPEIFREICDLLHDLELTVLRPFRVYGTVRDSYEFCAVLRTEPQ